MSPDFGKSKEPPSLLKPAGQTPEVWRHQLREFFAFEASRFALEIPGLVSNLVKTAHQRTPLYKEQVQP